MRQSLRLAAVVLLAATACGGGAMRAAPTKAPRATTAGSDLGRAHDFTLATFEGGTFTLSDHFGKLPVVLNFWAPW
jgi:hypothetical protein